MWTTTCAPVLDISEPGTDRDQQRDHLQIKQFQKLFETTWELEQEDDSQ